MTQAKRVLVLVSDDKLGRRLLKAAPTDSRVIYALDKSTSLKRVLKLVTSGRLSLFLVLKMFFAEFFRENTILEVSPKVHISTNLDLRNVISSFGINEVYLFRAGLIINNKTLQLPVKFLNLHCAKLPEFGGIGVIQKALNRQAFLQEATLHHVVRDIDSGEILRTQAYTLNPKVSYRDNEDAAYNAGISLLSNELKKFLSHC